MLRPYKRVGRGMPGAQILCYLHAWKAQYVDEKMHEIADVTKTVDTQKVAVLAALAIADELHSMQRDRGDHEQLMREQAERCLTLVERALKQTA